jgi:predicted RNA methylase
MQDRESDLSAANESIGTTLRRLLYRPMIKRRLIKIPVVRRLYVGWQRIHPLDLAFAIDTSGYMPAEQLTTDRRLASLINPYAASSPSVVRKSLAALLEVESYTFVDLGCGKGRAMIVASELPFKRIVGVDLCTELLEVAQKNIEKVKQAYPTRPEISLVESNALEFRLPPGNVVVFIYHAFGRELMRDLTKLLESWLASSSDHLFVVYYNPVYAEFFDESPAFCRWYARTIKHDASEIGFAPDDEDTVVIWQCARGKKPTPHARADRAVAITQLLWRASLE